MADRPREPETDAGRDVVARIRGIADALEPTDAKAQAARWRERLTQSGVLEALPKVEDRRAIVDDTLDYAVLALRATQMWLAAATRRSTGNVLILCGPPGIGKTMSGAWALARSGGRYTTMDDYVRTFLRWRRDQAREDRTTAELEGLLKARLLVLDELGTEEDPAAARDAMRRLADRRQGARDLTMVLTNLSKPDLEARLVDGTYDPRTWDRWRRAATIVGLKGDSMR